MGFHFVKLNMEFEWFLINSLDDMMIKMREKHMDLIECIKGYIQRHQYFLHICKMSIKIATVSNFYSNIML